MYMVQITDEMIDWLKARIPDPPRSPLGGRPLVDKRRVLRGIFWMLDNGAKWKDLPSEFGSKSTVHCWFQIWVRAGVFETIMRDAGRMVEERGAYRLYECFVDGTFGEIGDSHLFRCPALSAGRGGREMPQFSAVVHGARQVRRRSRKTESYLCATGEAGGLERLRGRTRAQQSGRGAIEITSGRYARHVRRE